MTLKLFVELFYLVLFSHHHVCIFGFGLVFKSSFDISLVVITVLSDLMPPCLLMFDWSAGMGLVRTIHTIYKLGLDSAERELG